MHPEGRTFDTVEEQLRYERDIQVKKHKYIYPLVGAVAAGTTQIFTVDIESGSDFKCTEITGSAYGYGYDPITMITTDSSFPMPGAAAFAMRGLFVQISDSNSGRNLTSGFTAFETLFTPGYGVAFDKPVDFRYLFYRNNKIRVDVRNADVIEHAFNIQFSGYRYETPTVAGR